MVDAMERKWKSSGIRRLVNAARHQLAGIGYGLTKDPAIREVSVACIVFCLVAVFLPVSWLETLLLILPLLLVALMEYVNSAIEAIVDRISLEPHPLSKIAKDYGSVAVGLSVLMAVLSWVVIVGPLFLAWTNEQMTP